MQRIVALVLTFLVVSTSLLAFVPAAEAASVTTETTKLQVPLVGASAVGYEGRTYLFGGRLADGSYSDKIWAYEGGALREVPTTLPRAPGDTASAGRYSGTAALVGSKIYYFGGAQLIETDVNGDGTNERVPRASRDIIEFDPATERARVTADKLPLGTWGMSVVVSSGAAYLFGGFTFDLVDISNTGRHDWVLRYDTSVSEGSSQRLRELDARLPYAVQDSAAVVMGRRAFIIGGLSDHDDATNPCPSYTYYDPSSGQEQTRQIEVCLTKRMISFDITFGLETMIGIAGEIPYRAQFITAAVVGEKAYIAGAHLPDGTASSSIIEIALVRDQPQARVIVPTLPRGIFGQGIATNGETILAFGGRTGLDRDLSSDIVRIDPRVTVPWAPRSATATEIAGGGGVRLTWEAPSYNGDGVITGYRVYRSSPGETEARLTETTGLSYEDRTVRPGTEYVWRVSAVNAAGESAQSARVTRSAGTTVPGMVAAFTAEPGDGEVILEWRPPTETGGANLTGYRITRNDQQLLIVTDLQTLKYVDTGVQNGMTYVYQIMARNAKGDGAPSEALRVTPAPGPDAPTNVFAEALLNGEGVRLTWSPTADRYHVYRSEVPTRAGERIAENVTSTSYVDNLAQRGRTYYYRVTALNDVGDSPRSDEAVVSLVSKPGAPTDVVALGMEGEIRISWTAPANTGDAPAANLRYTIARGTAGQAPRFYRTDLEATVFVDRFVTPGTEYTYTVTTLNPTASDPSAAATAAAKTLPKRPPVAILSALPPVASAGDPIELDASQSSDLDGSIVRYLFDFGDGTDTVSSTSPVVTHQYARNGTWTATVVVTDSDNLPSEIARAQIVVGETIREIDSNLPSGNIRENEPGSTAPAIPGPAPLLVLAVLVLAALGLRRRER